MTQPSSDKPQTILTDTAKSYIIKGEISIHFERHTGSISTQDVAEVFDQLVDVLTKETKVEVKSHRLQFYINNE